MRYLITGGAGFIGSALIRHLAASEENTILNIDSLTYAGNLESLESVEHLSNYTFKNINICDFDDVCDTVRTFAPTILMHLAAESHVDRSIDEPGTFMQTNIIGTYNLLEATRLYLESSDEKSIKNFRFHHISTDEVYGDLVGTNDLFIETTPYSPSSPYSASKASSDHLVRAWGRTFQLPYIINTTHYLKCIEWKTYPSIWQRRPNSRLVIC